MPKDIHLICQQGDGHRNCGDAVFESGSWVVADDTADQLIGGRIYLHSRKREAAWHGGTILSHCVDDNDLLRKNFRYQVDGPFRIKCPGGWGQEKAIVDR